MTSRAQGGGVRSAGARPACWRCDGRGPSSAEGVPGRVRPRHGCRVVRVLGHVDQRGHGGGVVERRSEPHAGHHVRRGRERHPERRRHPQPLGLGPGQRPRGGLPARHPERAALGGRDPHSAGPRQRRRPRRQRRHRDQRPRGGLREPVRGVPARPRRPRQGEPARHLPARRPGSHPPRGRLRRPSGDLRALRRPAGRQTSSSPWATRWASRAASPTASSPRSGGP